MKNILNYLIELEQNNNADWYHENKDKRQLVNTQFEALIQSLILDIGKTDESILHNLPKDLTFKQVRDTRFSNDKSPYHPCMRAHIGPCGKRPIPVGYYMMIKPNNRSFLGGGLFGDMFKEATAMIRDYLVGHGAEFEQIVSAPEFTQYFEVKGETLKKVPRGYDANHPYAKWLKYKSWYLEYKISDEALLKTDFIGQATKIFIAMQPFHAFLNRALHHFKMPDR